MTPEPAVKVHTGAEPPASFARYKTWVESELSRSVPDASDTGLHVLLRYHLGWADQDGRKADSSNGQGKALRPILCLFACEALSDNIERAASAAAALELIHNFSLIHDDIQDQDEERRHRPTLWYLWGVPRALVAGNALQSVADLALLKTAHGNTEPELVSPEVVLPRVVLKVSQLLTASNLEMIQGQCMDLDFESRTNITTEEYLEMIACKTGALFRCGLEIGALLATEDLTAVRAFSQFGSYLGRVFQIRDDYLGIWGDEATTGKPAGNDIRRRKKSFPVVFAFGQAQGPGLEDLLRIYQQDQLDDKDVERVLVILDEVGAKEESQRLTESSVTEALQALDDVALPAWAREEAETLVDFLARRDY